MYSSTISPDLLGPSYTSTQRRMGRKGNKMEENVEKQYPPYTVAKFRTDSEPTIVGNKVWTEWLDEEGILHERAAPHSQ